MADNSEGRTESNSELNEIYNRRTEGPDQDTSIARQTTNQLSTLESPADEADQEEISTDLEDDTSVKMMKKREKWKRRRMRGKWWRRLDKLKTYEYPLDGYDVYYDGYDAAAYDDDAYDDAAASYDAAAAFYDEQAAYDDAYGYYDAYAYDDAYGYDDAYAYDDGHDHDDDAGETSHGEMLDELKLNDEFLQHKKNYYMTKMKYEHLTDKVIQELAKSYVRGIQWILLYYYEGMPSWSWFYPHHYAPYMSDVNDFNDMDLTFDLGTPFLPFDQLMAVLDTASKYLLPQRYQRLMTDASSSVIDFYPSQCERDLNEKKQDWEAVVLMPFIDEKRLLEAISCESHLLTEEKSPNKHGPHLLYTYSDNDVNHVRLTEIEKDAFHLASNTLKKGLIEGAKLNVFYPGFPTFQYIPHEAKFQEECYKMIIYIPDNLCSKDIEMVADEYIGKEIYVNWPHLYEAKVVAVCNEKYSYTKVEVDNSSESGNTRPSIKTTQHDYITAEKWKRERNSIVQRYDKKCLGVKVSSITILLRALPMTGMKYIPASHGRVTVEKQFGNQPVTFALQATVKFSDLTAHNSSSCQFTSVTDYLPNGCQVFMLDYPYYGCQGEVKDHDLEKRRVRIELSAITEPILDDKFTNLADFEHNGDYFPVKELAKMNNISDRNIGLFSRLTGDVFIIPGNAEEVSQQQKTWVNVGLNLKSLKSKEEVPGLTKFDSFQWLYSNECAKIFKEYNNKFPEMFELLSVCYAMGYDNVYESDVIPPNCSKKLKDVEEYIKGLACTNAKSQIGAKIVPKDVIFLLQREIDNMKINRKIETKQVRPDVLYRPIITSGTLIPDPSATYKLFDRVVNTRQEFAVPFGLRGTIVGIYPEEIEMNTLFEVLSKCCLTQTFLAVSLSEAT
ncbi:5'-3' exoribonuclease 1-like [Dreissena polymorpha]|uniref:5'-3' exoribonuclease 1-like n=1 Tax=Dreissena polymorpha TaxID=45954 RepID=UPI0022644D71|nr:5'-3' exoribonuclease 1-like [Dreissena polymorpha]XP_052259063.1 5'-3' exoribonuclease 1-like [Dreissena polymorpha]XP_052259065.1 5'-3' exoribonuclease 1-like [Dreissena polymorpha]